MKKQFIAPRITKVVNEELMAEVCNETFIYTSKGGASNGYANVCYHYRSQPNSNNKITYSRFQRAVVINIPKGAEFVTTPRDGVTIISTSETPDWYDFEGTNGTCHFIGDIYINGELLDTPEKIAPYLSGQEVKPI